MPRPKGKRGLKRFTYRSHELSVHAKTQLAQILDRESLPEAALNGIEKALGLAVDSAKHHIDNPPRPTDYISEFTRVRADAWKLCDRIAEWDYYYRDQFDDIEDTDLFEIERSLVSLYVACGKIVQHYEDLGPGASKGARKDRAIAEVVKRLCEIFETHYQGSRTPRKRRGALESQADWEKREFDFVKTALLDARAIHEVYAKTKLTRLIRVTRGVQ